jgi:hypothetical protein
MSEQELPEQALSALPEQNIFSLLNSAPKPYRNRLADFAGPILVGAATFLTMDVHEAISPATTQLEANVVGREALISCTVGLGAYALKRVVWSYCRSIKEAL